MKRLPYIDEHAITVEHDRADTWAALLRRLGGPPVGFAIGERTAPERLVLQGRHPFSTYQWIFELDEVAPDRTRLRSQTWAEFPGLHGKIYRALVIGSGAHRIVVRRMLRKIAAATS